MHALRLAVLVAAATGLAVPALALEPAAADSTEMTPLEWSRRVVQLRKAIDAVEAALDPGQQAALAHDAYFAAADFAASAPPNAAVRDLLIRAQAAYEPHHGPVASMPLAPSEWSEIRGPALAGLGPNFVPAVEDPAIAAARRAEAARAAGPAWLFYPASAADLVERQRGAARRLVPAGRRGRRLLGRIEQTLQRRGVPTDLRYVAVIESALNPNAESWAGARGLWQFMPETAAEYGLDSLSVADPAASTEAAARYLRWLHRQFRGDWQLAMAAYNCGVGRVRRLVREHQEDTETYPTFWDLHDALPRETQAYVPRFIAVAEALGARG